MAFGMALSANAQLLWKVEGNGLEKPSYLFGTHHIAPAGWVDSVPGLNDAILAVDEIYGEVKSGDMDPNAVFQKLMVMGQAPADSTLDKVVSAEVLAKADSLMVTLTGMQGLMQRLNGMQPIIVSTQLTALQSFLAFPGFDPNQQLDMVVMERGKADGKEINGFETAEEQLEILLGQSIADQAADFTDGIEKWDEQIVKVQNLAEAYKEQNLDKISALMFDPDNGMKPAEAKRLIYDRNHRWVERMCPQMPEHSILVSVGCGHLVGPEGLIQLLQEAGYTVTPVL